MENEPGWGADGFALSKVDGGPDLGPISAFLGLDEAKTERLRETLRNFGERLREIERENARLEYRGDGTARIDFGDAEASRRGAFDHLEGKLVEALGSRDAARFLAATTLLPEGATSNAIRVKVEARGSMMRVNIPNSLEVFLPRERATISKEMFTRVQHLRLGIDWDRLIQEADGKLPEQ